VDNYVDNHRNYLQNRFLVFNSLARNLWISIIFRVGMARSNRLGTTPNGAEISVRVAVYSKEGELEVMEVAASRPQSATAKLCALILEQVRELGGDLPEVAVREVLDNLIHAGYRGVVISLLDGGKTLRVSDKGPGIRDKERVFEFGFTGASAETSQEIRGVGAGLGIARAAAEKAGGSVTVEDNIGGGTVVTISTESGQAEKPEKQTVEPAAPPKKRYPDAVPKINISERQQKVLLTVVEHGEIGPSTVADQLEISVSTAYRDLSVLEEDGLVESNEAGKRVATHLGRDLVRAIVKTWVQ
jgi:anti-sigma regulatory factor (Ser/Thr protein kinase)/predicted transcriptional regulator